MSKLRPQVLKRPPDMLDKEFRQLKQEYHAWVLHYIVRSQLDAVRVTGLKVGEDMPHSEDTKAAKVVSLLYRPVGSLDWSSTQM
jgi:hypothetical protein